MTVGASRVEPDATPAVTTDALARAVGDVVERRARLEDDVVADLANQHLIRGEPEVLRQTDGLAAVGNEDLGGVGALGPSETRMPYTNRIWRHVRDTCVYPGF